MISSATLFLATLVFHAAAVLGAPISLSAAEIAPRSLDNSASVRFARDASFPETFPTIVERAVVDSFPIIARETEDIVRRYPRRFIHEYLEKRGTTIHEKVTVTEKTIKHDNPIDTVSYNNGHPQNKCCNGTNGNSCNGNGNGNGNSNNGAPTPTATTTPTAPAAPTPTVAAPDAPKPPVAGNTDGPKPAGCPAQPGAPGCPTPDTTTPTTPPAAGNDPSTPANGPKPDGTTTTDGPKPDGTNGADGPKPDGTTTDGSNKPAGGSKPTDGAPDPTTTTPADGSKPTDGTDPAATTPAPAPDASAANGGDGTKGGEGNTESRRRGLKVEAANQPIAKRDLAYSGAAWASSLRRRAL